MLLHLRRYHGRPFSWIAIISCAASLLLPNKACTLLALSLSSRLMIQRASLGGHRSSIVIFKITNVDVPSLLYMFMHQLSNMFLVKKKKAGIYLCVYQALRPVGTCFQSFHVGFFLCQHINLLQGRQRRWKFRHSVPPP